MTLRSLRISSLQNLFRYRSNVHILKLIAIRKLLFLMYLKCLNPEYVSCSLHCVFYVAAISVWWWNEIFWKVRLLDCYRVFSFVPVLCVLWGGLLVGCFTTLGNWHRKYQSFSPHNRIFSTCKNRWFSSKAKILIFTNTSSRLMLLWGFHQLRWFSKYHVINCHDWSLFVSGSLHFNSNWRILICSSG